MKPIFFNWRSIKHMSKNNSQLLIREQELSKGGFSGLYVWEEGAICKAAQSALKIILKLTMW